MQIYTRTTYHIAGASFDTEKKARDWLYDQIGNTLDKALSDLGAGTVGPRERIAMVDAITSNAAAIHTLLGAYVAPVDRDMQGT